MEDPARVPSHVVDPHMLVHLLDCLPSEGLLQVVFMKSVNMSYCQKLYQEFSLDAVVQATEHAAADLDQLLKEGVEPGMAHCDVL